MDDVTEILEQRGYSIERGYQIQKHLEEIHEDFITESFEIRA